MHDLFLGFQPIEFFFSICLAFDHIVSYRIYMTKERRKEENSCGGLIQYLIHVKHVTWNSDSAHEYFKSKMTSMTTIFTHIPQFYVTGSSIHPMNFISIFSPHYYMTSRSEGDRIYGLADQIALNTPFPFPFPFLYTHDFYRTG